MRRAAESNESEDQHYIVRDAQSCQESLVRRGWRKGEHLCVLESIQEDPSGFKV